MTASPPMSDPNDNNGECPNCGRIVVSARHECTPNDKQKCGRCGGKQRVLYNGAASAVFPDGIPCPSCAPRVDGSAAEVKREPWTLPLRGVNTGAPKIRIEDANGNTVAYVYYCNDDYGKQIKDTLAVARVEAIVAACNAASRVAELEQTIASYSYHVLVPLEEHNKLERDAENWRALMACRMSPMGCAGLHPDKFPTTAEYGHLTLNFWTGEQGECADGPEYPQDWLNRFMAKAVANYRAALSKGAQT